MSDDPIIYWLDFTPEIAAEWLANPVPDQRPQRKSKIATYAAEMAAENWLPTGEAIKRDKFKRLMDGQHRLSAVMASGRTVRMLVIDNCDPNIMDVLDTGMPRTFADVLRGNQHARTLAAITRRMFLWDKGEYVGSGNAFLSPEGRRVPSHTELIAYLADHPELPGLSKLADHWYIPRMAASLAGTCAVLFSRLDHDDMISFMDAWDSGANLAYGSPILTLRERIARDTPLTDKRGDVVPEIKIALACIAWNAFREGRPLMKLQLPRGGLTKGNYPFPH